MGGVMGEIGNIFGGNSGPTAQANTAKLNQMNQAAENDHAYRPELAQARINALSNRMQAYQGANNALAAMYGQGNAQAPSQALKNPMSNSMMGQPAGSPGQDSLGSYDHTISGSAIGGAAGAAIGSPVASALDAPLQHHPGLPRPAWQASPSDHGTANGGLGNRKPRGKY